MTRPTKQNIWGVDFVKRAEVTGMPVWDFPNPTFGRDICHHSKCDQITQVQESAGSAVGDISLH